MNRFRRVQADKTKFILYLVAFTECVGDLHQVSQVKRIILIVYISSKNYKLKLNKLEFNISSGIMIVNIKECENQID